MKRLNLKMLVKTVKRFKFISICVNIFVVDKPFCSISSQQRDQDYDCFGMSNIYGAILQIPADLLKFISL